MVNGTLTGIYRQRPGITICVTVEADEVEQQQDFKWNFCSEKENEEEDLRESFNSSWFTIRSQFAL